MANAQTTGGATPSGAASYDSIAQAVHWLVAALAVIAVPLGWAIAGAPRNTPERDLFLLLHRSVGLTILAAMVFRTGWRWRHMPPPLPSDLARLDIALARVTHFILYLFLIMMPLAGYLNAAAAGHAVNLFGIVSVPPLLPENDRLSQVAIAIHLVGQYPLYLFIALHIAGALFHGAIRRDRIVERMLPMRRAG
jgi:cytochrome b561